MGQYWYDDQGFRVRKMAYEKEGENTVVKEILYPSMYFATQRERTVAGEIVDNSTASVNNIYINGIRVAAVTSEGGARYYHQDQVDSVKLVTDENGTTVTRFEYFPYGETWIQENGAGEEGKHSPKYNSQELDKETGYYFYNARHYDPEIARFVTADTVVDGEDYDDDGNVIDSNPLGWNRYMYVRGNPIQYKDPTGHEAQQGLKKGLETGVKFLKEGVKLVEPVAKNALSETLNAELSGLVEAGKKISKIARVVCNPAVLCASLATMTGDGGSSNRKRKDEVILDTSVLPGQMGLTGVKPNEKPVITKEVFRETFNNYWDNKKSNGKKYRAFDKSTMATAIALPKRKDTKDSAALSRISSLYRQMNNGVVRKGDAGDIKIAATALATNKTLITGDRKQYSALVKAGGKARFIKTNQNN